MKMKTKLTTPSLHKHVEHWEIVHIVGGDAKCTVTLEISRTVSYQIKHIPTIQL